MNAFKLAGSVATKYAAVGATLIVPMLALAAEPHEVAVQKIEGLQTGVSAVGAAILGITLAIIGYKVITRMANRA